MHYALTDPHSADDFPYELHLGAFTTRCVLGDDVPYLRVWIPEKALWVEEDALIWGDWLLIGTTETVYCIRLEDRTVREIPADGYFKMFLPMGSRLFFFEATGLTALDRECNLLWQNHRLAVDGCLFCEMRDDTIMRVSCEMDPPGGWTDSRIDITNGTII